MLGLFCAALFSHDHALELNENNKAAVEKAAMLEEEDPAQTKEYRTYKMWLNSIIPYIEGASSVVDILEDLRDGILLVQILNVISEGTLVIKWKKDINLKQNRYHKVENVNFAIKLCQELGFNLHNIAGLDILDCEFKATLRNIVEVFTLPLINDSFESVGNQTNSISQRYR